MKWKKKLKGRTKSVLDKREENVKEKFREKREKINFYFR